MTTELIHFTQWARHQPQAQYNALMGLLGNPEGLMDRFEAQPGNKAAGIDKASKAEYAQSVEVGIPTLIGH